MLSVESTSLGIHRHRRAARACRSTVPDNAIVGVLGPNGAGKTALLRAISGLNPVHGGRIRFAGTNSAGPRPTPSCGTG